MSLITIAWSMAAAACAMMGLMHILLWLKERRRGVYLLSASMAFGAAASALLELGLLRSQTALEYKTLLRWENLSIYLLLVSLVWFVYLHFGTARRWLAVLITALWTIGIIVNFLSPGSLVYSEPVGLRTEGAFWGETFTLGVGPTNPWKFLADLASLLILAYVVDASVKAWRRGNRERAMVVGVSIVVFMVSAGIHTPMVDAGILATPYMVSFAFLAIVIAMTYEVVSAAFLASHFARQVRADEARWRTLLENVQLLVVGLDRSGRTTYINPYGRELLGYKDPDLLGRTWIDRVVPEGHRASLRSEFRDRLLKGNLPSHQNQIRSREGDILEVKWSNVVLYDADGAVAGTLSIGENLTPRIRAEHEARRERDALAHLTRVSAMGELAASLAHELNQPLTAMLSNAQAAQRFMAATPPDLDEVRDILVDLVKDNQRATNVIRRLRALAKREQHEFEAVDLRRVTQEVVHLLHSDSVIRHIQVGLECPVKAAVARADEIQIQQVVLNLLLNAFDAVSERPMSERRVSVEVSRMGDSWVVSVRDNGSGLAPERLSEVFEPFFSTKRSGIGMGLAISRSIVEAHGGRLWVENNPDQGATFRFTVPVEHAAPGQKAV